MELYTINWQILLLNPFVPPSEVSQYRINLDSTGKTEAELKALLKSHQASALACSSPVQTRTRERATARI